MTPAMFAAAALIAGAASMFAAAVWLRAGAYLVLVAGLLAVWWTALGHPRPALFGVPKGTVVGFHLDEPKAIDVMVKPSHGGAPILYALPWNEADAEALVRTERAAKRLGRALEMRGRQGGGQSGYAHQRRAGPVFYPAPAPQLPAKQRP